MSQANKLRLVALYALRYQKHAQSALPILLDLLSTVGGIAQSRIDLIPKLLIYASSLQTAAATGGAISDIFESTSLLTSARDRFKGLKGVENVYTQHSPRLEVTLQNLIRGGGKLSEKLYPFVEGGGSTRDKPQDIVVFIIGGVTYEEAKLVASLNIAQPGVRIVLGGTGIINSEIFLEEMQDAVGKWPEPPAGSAIERLRKEIGRK